MTSKECLRHPWLAKKPRISHLGGSVSSGINNRRSESPVLAAAAAAGGSGAAQKNLRKYLSKSREALFERVSGSNLRKTLSKSRERLCESHLSLVSKSRERLLMLEPSSRSIEKLYGLRSLSKSHDALSGQEMWAASCINPALAAQHRLRCQSEGTSLGRDFDNETPTPTPDQEPSVINSSVDSVSIHSLVDNSKLTKTTEENTHPVSTSFSLPIKTCNNTSQTTVKVACVAPPATTNKTSNPAVPTKVSSNVSTSDKLNIKNSRQTLNTAPHFRVEKNIKSDPIIKKGSNSPKSPKISRKIETVDKSENLLKTKDGNNKENQVENSTFSAEQIKQQQPPLNDTVTVSLALLGVGGEENKQLKRVQIQDPKKIDETASDSSDKTIRWSEKSPSPFSGDDDEPRYSVAQLVSAYNKNDQIAATSAITYDRTIPSKLKFVSRFPTGANALRLFIPDIMISDRKQLSASPRVGTLSDPLSEVKECTTSPESSLSPVPSVEEQPGPDEANNNNTQCHNNSECHFLKVPEEKKEPVAFARSGSLSSEASGYDTLSGASSLVSLEESSPPTSLTPNQSPDEKTEKKISRPRSSSLHTDSLRPPWGLNVCTGSYSRAMERFHNKHNLIHQPNCERQRRKSSPVIKASLN